MYIISVFKLTPMKVSFFVLTLFCVFISTFSQAHIGSAGVAYEGKIGPYQVQVFIQPPDVVPGTARVTILTDGTDIEAITLTPIYFFAGDEGSPRADLALPTLEKGQYEGTIWFMETGSASVRVRIKGGRGTGEVAVPVGVVSTAKRSMPNSTSWLLIACGLLLIGLMITIIGASNSDSLMQLGQHDSAKTKRSRIIGSVIGASLCGLVLWGGNAWWNSWADDYRRFMFKPIMGSASISIQEGQRKLTLQIDSTTVKNRWLSYLIPDHGKLMHLFLVRQGTMDVFTHLHPSRKDTLLFEAMLPSIPSGKYLLYADVVRYHGFAYTITDTVDIPGTPKVNAATFKPITTDSEDTYVVTNPLNGANPLLQDATITQCGSPGIRTTLQDCSTIVWEEQTQKPLQAGKFYSLKFSVLSPDKKPAQLQPYLGIMGHAAIIKDDGSVYIHLHPTGTFSSASQQVIEKRIADTTQKFITPSAIVFKDSIDRYLQQLQQLPIPQRDSLLASTMKHTVAHHATVSFPYAFPQPGNYRIWLQVKRNGRILTGVFEAKVL
ncbi:MAG: hypothetical protein U0Y10_16625 [Spirosomataceae bacterium]